MSSAVRPTGGPLSGVLGTVLLLTGVFFLNFVARVGLGPLLPAIEQDLGIGHAEAGAIFLSLSLGYCMGLLGSGLVAARLTHRWTIVLSSLTVGAALAGTALGRGLGALHGGTALLGVAAGLYLPSGIATLTATVKPADWGKALAVHELAPNVSFVAAPLLAEALLAWLPWRGVLALFGVAAAAGGLVFAASGRGAGLRGAPPSGAALGAALRNPSLWVLMLLFSLALGASLGVYTMLPLYLVADLGLARPTANTLVAASRLSGLGTVFAAGWLADRLGARRTLGLALGAAGVLTVLLGVLEGPPLLVAVFLQPALAVCFFPVGFALLSRVSPLGVSLAIPVAIRLGAGGIPALIGALAAAGSFPLAMGVVGGAILAGAALTRFVGEGTAGDGCE